MTNRFPPLPRWQPVVGVAVLLLVVTFLGVLVVADVCCGMRPGSAGTRGLIVVIVAIALGLGAAAMGGMALARVNGREPTTKMNVAVSLGGGVAACFLTLALGFYAYVPADDHSTLVLDHVTLQPSGPDRTVVAARFRVSGTPAGHTVWLLVSDQTDCQTTTSRGMVDHPMLGEALHFAAVASTRLKCAQLVLEDHLAQTVRRSRPFALN